MTLEEIIASLSPLESNAFSQAMQGEDLRGGSPFGYLDDAPTYSDAEIQRAAQQIRESGEPLVDGVNYFNTGIPQLNEALYGPDISVNLSYDGSGFETPRNLQSNSAFDLGMDVLGYGFGAALGGVTGNLVGSLLGDGLLAPAISNAAGSAVNNSVRDSFDQNLNISGVVGPNGAMPDLAEGEINNENPLDGLLGNSPITIPIPGLPAPIPGNMSWEDLVEIARRTGQTVQDVFNDITAEEEEGVTVNPTPDPTPVMEDETQIDIPIFDDRVESPAERPEWGYEFEGPQTNDIPELQEEDDLSLGQPIWWEGGSLPGYEVPVEGPLEGPSEPPSLVPGDTPSTPNPALITPFLIPLFDQEQQEREEIGLWDYQGPDTSYGYETPDYGTPDYMDPYDFRQQPSQPSQVGYNPEKRRSYLGIFDQERVRR